MSRQSEQVAENMRKRVAKLAGEFILEVDKELRREGTGTPVDTGNARANWVPSIGAPFTGIATNNGPHDAGVIAILAYELKQGALYESNNVPYMRALNNGHSKQAPAGFIERAIDVASATMRDRIAAAEDVTK
jgi:hypothetical protein